MIKIYGESDDLIEIDGHICEEFSRFDSEGDYLAVSDGTVLRIVYDNDGIWRVSLVFRGSLFDHIDQGSVEKDINDIAYFKDGVKWIVCGKDLAK